MIGFLALSGCGGARRRGAGPPPVPVPSPVLEKTFGEIQCGERASFVIKYKDILFAVDPAAETNPAPDLKTIDYLFLTDGTAQAFAPAVRAAMNAKLKILAPPAVAADLKKTGFPNARSLEPGRKILLQKGEAFLFVTAFGRREARTNGSVNSYFLEFDNGRNVFIGGDQSTSETLRDTLLSIRDEGKEIHVALVYAGATSVNETGAAETISLLQPSLAVVTQSSPPKPAWNQKTFESALREQVFYGAAHVARPGDRFAF